MQRKASASIMQHKAAAETLKLYHRWPKDGTLIGPQKVYTLDLDYSNISVSRLTSNIVHLGLTHNAGLSTKSHLLT
jgi:hypothetical protein